MSGTHVIIGSGPDALAAAIVLAEAGREVHVYEGHGDLGGTMWSRAEFGPGYWAPGLHHDVRVDASLIKKLCGVHAAGVLGTPPSIDTPAGHIPGDPLAPGQLVGWEARRAWLQTVRQGLRAVVRAPAPAFTKEGSVWPLMRMGASLRWMGKPALRQLLRRGVLSIQDDLDEEQDLDPGLRASMALDGLAGTWLGPRDPTTNGLALLRSAVSDEVAQDGAALVQALAEKARALGVGLHLDCPLSAISLRDGQVDGVVVGNKRVPCEAALMTEGLGLLLDTLPEFSVPPRLQHSVKHVRRRGTVALVRMGLSSPLTVAGRCVERVRTAMELDDLERAHDAVKYGRLPEMCPLDARQWSAGRNDLAPEGHHVVSVHVHGVPSRGDLSADLLVERVMKGLSPYHDQLAEDTVCVDVLRPYDLQEKLGLPGGHLWYAEMALDQLWITRPFGSFAQHETPWNGIYVASLASHPGTLALGSGGVHAARMMLASH